MKTWSLYIRGHGWVEGHERRPGRRQAWPIRSLGALRGHTLYDEAALLEEEVVRVEVDVENVARRADRRVVVEDHVQQVVVLPEHRAYLFDLVGDAVAVLVDRALVVVRHDVLLETLRLRTQEGNGAVVTHYVSSHPASHFRSQCRIDGMTVLRIAWRARFQSCSSIARSTSSVS